jgi:hypothetical protein
MWLFAEEEVMRVVGMYGNEALAGDKKNGSKVASTNI